MRLSYIAAFLSFLLLFVDGAVYPKYFQQNDILAAKALIQLEADASQNGFPSNSCTLQNAAVRQEWGSFTLQERTNYINAVLCLASKPSITPRSQVPGARSRYDDFVATHMNQTLNIHATGNFLSWHRYFVWTYEKALREECGYRGYQPYHNWAKWATDPKSSPSLDGSNTSMSGDGSYVHHDPVGIPSDSQPAILLPTAQGGGCVTSGPFQNFTVHLGPVIPSLNYVTPNPDKVAGFGYNPRCLRRDISAYVSSRYTNDDQVSSLITQNNDIYWFAFLLQGGLFQNQFLGAHTGGHYTIGGDPGGDFFTSPGDPWFFLHHAMLDRTWWTWQNQDPEKRTYTISQTMTVLNSPPSRNATLDDEIDLGVNAPPMKIRDGMSSIGGPYCYIYG